MTGTLYERHIDTLPSTTKQHPIPSGYWKIIFTASTPTEETFAAFIMDQDTPRAASFCSYQVTVEEIEQRSGLKVWTTLPAAEQAARKPVRGQFVKDIGC
ncbi:DNA/RNA non-specific endonuclease [Pseudomonas asplenii]|uniref:DNA/RNA non-specific endonuclease n=1 Tax=Pseudomonas asplenii TaxID=53407 RepID=UPI0006CCF9D8|nr:DNA/RNA non-specific endonuclease [Pseudomonas fuscovaginae]KPA96372.1 DNA/RNA endonuclease G, NUC1 [Pseudomonas fuscovaginae]